VLLSFYGLNSLLLTVLYVWPWGRRAQGGTSASQAAGVDWPAVTVQLPIYNEKHTAERLLEAVAALDYPRDRLQVQVLDDSTDETRALAADAVARLRGDGLEIAHLTRPERNGYKAGALAAGLDSASGTLIAVLDADFVPPPSFLRDTVPHLSDPAVGCVQARWGHANREYNSLTRLQALMMDGHFVVEQGARDRYGLPMNFNGTAGVWRRACIEDAGGWTLDTLTEDLDLSYRAQMRGWQLRYLSQAVVPGELPVQVGAFKRQQARWAQGSIQTALKTVWPLLRSRLSWAAKVEGLLHLTGYLAHPLLLLNLLLLLPVRLVQEADARWAVGTLRGAPALAAIALGPPLLFAVAQAVLGRGWGRRLRALPLLILAGVGVSLNNAWAVLKALLGVRQGFLRTPKFAVRERGAGRRESWMESAYALGLDPLIWGELALACYSLALLFWPSFRWDLAPWLILYAGGFGYLAGTGLVQAWRRRRVWRGRRRRGRD
jgi:cellulose synthase/poly-beta-1,6-N-acetylglucosamine synthase-like glycosyltransferase